MTPTIGTPFRDAARNHELEHTYRAERTVSKDRRRESDRDRRSQVAQAFLADSSQRAMPHPRPSPTRCFLATAGGRVMFDTSTDVGVARDLPQEAYRRFQADFRARKERNLKRRAEHLALHDEKVRLIAEWASTRATEEQRSRYAAGVLPVEEAIDALTE